MLKKRRKLSVTPLHATLLLPDNSEIVREHGDEIVLQEVMPSAL